MASLWLRDIIHQEVNNPARKTNKTFDLFNSIRLVLMEFRLTEHKALPRITGLSEKSS